MEQEQEQEQKQLADIEKPTNNPRYFIDPDGDLHFVDSPVESIVLWPRETKKWFKTKTEYFINAYFKDGTNLEYSRDTLGDAQRVRDKLIKDLVPEILSITTN